MPFKEVNLFVEKKGRKVLILTNML